VISDLAEEQHGVVALSQLRELGLSVQRIDKRVAAGWLHPVHRGVYAVGHRLLSADGHRMAAVIACGPGAVLSHRSAAAAWGLRRDGRNRIDVTAPGRRGRMPAGIEAHRDGSLRPADRTEVRGIPCTSVARTLLDLAAVVSPRELRNAVTQAEVERVFDLTAVREVLGRSRRRRGVARLRRAIAEHDPRDERARGELERSFLALCRQADLPLPAVNVPLTVGDTQLEADFLWWSTQLIVEADDRYSHLTVAAFEKDRRRDQRLRLAGWEVIRCTWRQVLDDPEELGHTLRALLQRPALTGPQQLMGR
jgi:predicted transcriptional regulator of viral defense system